MRAVPIAGYAADRVFLCLLLSALAGCSGASPLPALDAPPSSAGAAAAAQPGPVATLGSATLTNAPAKSGSTIVGFKSKTVVVYSSAEGTDGRRVAGETLNLPLKVRSRSANDRIEIITPEGIGWLASADVIAAQ